jgi:spore maturation protein A
MLNYIWTGLIVVSLLFALFIDVRELATDRFRNDQELPVRLDFDQRGYQTDTRRLNVDVAIDSVTYNDYFGTEGVAPDSSYAGTLVRTQDGLQLQFAGGDATARLPETLDLIRRFSADEEETAPVRSTALQQSDLAFNADSTAATTRIGFNAVQFRKLRDISSAALDAAEGAAELALGLIGVLALFLGLLQIADEAGLIYSLTNLVQPLLRPLFPRVPEGHPALAMVSLNLLANVFGLGNAATPLGIKAMEELQALNPTEDTATDSMVMLLALNTSSVQLVPPVLLVAIMGLQINQLIFSITLATLCSTIVGATAAYFLARSPWYKSSSPVRNAGGVVRDSSGNPLEAGSEEADVRSDEEE